MTSIYHLFIRYSSFFCESEGRLASCDRVTSKDRPLEFEIPQTDLLLYLKGLSGVWRGRNQETFFHSLDSYHGGAWYGTNCASNAKNLLERAEAFMKSKEDTTSDVRLLTLGFGNLP